MQGQPFPSLSLDIQLSILDALAESGPSPLELCDLPGEDVDARPTSCSQIAIAVCVRVCRAWQVSTSFLLSLLSSMSSLR